MHAKSACSMIRLCLVIVGIMILQNLREIVIRWNLRKSLFRKSRCLNPLRYLIYLIDVLPLGIVIWLAHLDIWLTIVSLTTRRRFNIRLVLRLNIIKHLLPRRSSPSFNVCIVALNPLFSCAIIKLLALCGAGPILFCTICLQLLRLGCLVHLLKLLQLLLIH